MVEGASSDADAWLVRFCCRPLLALHNSEADNYLTRWAFVLVAYPNGAIDCRSIGRAERAAKSYLC